MMDSKKAAEVRRAKGGLAEQQRSKRRLQQKLRQLEQARDRELDPLQRQIARLRTQVDQITARHAGPIGETMAQVAGVDVKIGEFERTLALHSPAKTVPAKPDARRSRKGNGSRRNRPFDAGTFVPALADLGTQQ